MSHLISYLIFFSFNRILSKKKIIIFEIFKISFGMFPNVGKNFIHMFFFLPSYKNLEFFKELFEQKILIMQKILVI